MDGLEGRDGRDEFHLEGDEGVSVGDTDIDHEPTVLVRRLIRAYPLSEEQGREGGGKGTDLGRCRGDGRGRR